jgi:hypothetical protein
MKHAFEIESCAMIYIPSFIKIVTGIQMLIRGDSQAHRQHGSYKPTFISKKCGMFDENRMFTCFFLAEIILAECFVV